MKKSIITLTVAAFAAMFLFSCNKNTDPNPEPAILEQENARVRLIADDCYVASIDIMADGTYIAELETEAEKYEGLAAYVHMPFERVPVNATSSVVTTYKRGSYTLNNNTYSFPDLCTVTPFDFYFMTVSFPGGNTSKARSGIIKESMPDQRSSNAVKAPGVWKPVGVEVTFSKDAETPKTHSFTACDLKEIATYLSNNGFDELAKHLAKFDGYKVSDVAISAQNAVAIEFQNAASIGGFWDLKDKDASYSKKVDNKELVTEASYKPAVSDNALTINLALKVTVDKNTVYNVNAKLSFNK